MCFASTHTGIQASLPLAKHELLIVSFLVHVLYAAHHFGACHPAWESCLLACGSLLGLVIHKSLCRARLVDVTHTKQHRTLYMLFGRKMAVFGPKLRRFGRAPPNLAPTPRAATSEFLAQNLDLARAPPRL